MSAADEVMAILVDMGFDPESSAHCAAQANGDAALALDLALRARLASARAAGAVVPASVANNASAKNAPTSTLFTETDARPAATPNHGKSRPGESADISDAERQRHLRDMSIRAEQRKQMSLVEQLRSKIYSPQQQRSPSPSRAPAPNAASVEVRGGSSSPSPLRHRSSGPPALSAGSPQLPRSASNSHASAPAVAAIAANARAPASPQPLRKMSSGAPSSPQPMKRSAACFACARETVFLPHEGDMKACGGCGCTVLLTRPKEAPKGSPKARVKR